MSRLQDPPDIFTAHAGVPATPIEAGRDPFVALDELMVVVEALCPVWPDRPTFEGSTRFLL
jgi:hypothetical protein